MKTDLTKRAIWEFDKNKRLEKIKIDGIPIWWFFKPTLILNTLPKPFLNFEEIIKKKERNFIEKIKIKILGKILGKYLLKNEKNKIKLKKGKSNSTTQEKILFLTYSNHVKNNNILRLTEIINKLNDKNIKPFPIVYDLLSNKSSKSILNYQHTFYEYIDKKILSKANNASKKISKLCKIRKDFLHKIILEEVNFLLSKEIIELILINYLTCDKIIKTENIKSIVITADTGFIDRALIAAAEKNNIPVIMVHHGNPGTVPIEKVTKICLKGESFKRNLKDFKGKIAITGFVDSDKIFKYKKPIKNKKNKILISTSPLVEDNFMQREEYENYIKKLIKELSEIKNSEIIINLHPRENNPEIYKKLTKNYENIKVIKKLDIDFLYNLLNSIDILIFFGSFVATEAMMLGKNAIYVDLFGKSNPYLQLYKNTEAVIKAKKEDNISKIVEKVFTDNKLQTKLKKAREQFVKEQCYKLDGKATERIVNEIQKSLEDGRKNTK